MTTRTDAAPADIRALGADLAQADDVKVLRVAAMLDDLSGGRVAQALMDPLRPRLAALRPSRPLRFARLLFIPFDMLIVPARAWRPGDPTLSRAAMPVIVATVRAALPDLSDGIDAEIAGRRTDATQLIAETGSRLWPAAAEVLASVPPPRDWDVTGLPIAVWPAIAQSAAIVLERAPALQALIRDARPGSVEPDENAIRAVLRGVPETPPEGSAMVMRLVLEQIPHTAPILRRMITMCRDLTEKRVLQQALDRGMDEMLDYLQAETGVIRDLGQASIANAGEEVRRLADLLDDLDNDPSGPRRKGRLQSIRDTLDTACQARFATGVEQGIVSPLARPGARVAGATQVAMERRARELKTFESAARLMGGSRKYEAMLGQAARAVESAGDSGALSTGRVVRLVEILLGSEAAEEIYLRNRSRVEAE